MDSVSEAVTSAATPRAGPPSRQRIDASVGRAARALARRQQTDGRWDCDTEMGIVGIATVSIVEALFRPADPGRLPALLRYFAARQRDDGSFPPFPGADRGSLETTALAVAGLTAAGTPSGDEVVERGRRYIERHGGLARVEQSFSRRGDFTALFLLAAGHVDSDFLPDLPPGLAIAAHTRVLQSRVHAGNVMTMLVLAALVARHRPPARGLLGAARHALTTAGIREYLLRWQNADGSYNGSPLQTSLILIGLHAAGMTAGDREVARALSWLEGMRRTTGDEARLCAMESDVWSTALCVLALHHADPEAFADEVDAGVDHLLSTQTRVPMPVENQRRFRARRTGGWPFQRGNDTMPDCDDTGVVVAALARTAGTRARRPIFRAIDDGVAWLRDMQNPDGGFPTFVWGLPSKPPGPMFTTDLPVELEDSRALVRSFLEPAPEYGDPALEGVTGRVLWGLGASGIGRDDPAVARAIDFLRAQQCDSGAWWGRWKVCYLAETATVLLGLAAVGEDMHEPYVCHAIDWVLRCQNEDGGFGEDPAAYRDPARAGCGPSCAAVTAYVLLGLATCGEADSSAAARAAGWLLEHQSDDDLWEDGGWLHTFVPPDLLYEYPLPSQALPVVALATYAEHLP